MAAKQALYLRRAAGARREPKHHCGECASLGENSISGGYGIMTVKQSLYLRIPVSAFTAESRALNSAGGCRIRRIWYDKRNGSQAVVRHTG